MTSGNTMKDVLSNLRFDKKTKEGAVLGDSYKDVKSFVQFYEGVKDQIAKNEMAAELAIKEYRLKPRQVGYELEPDAELMGKALDLAHMAFTENRPEDALGLIEKAAQELKNPSRSIIRIDLSGASFEGLTDDLQAFQRAIRAGALLHQTRGAFEHLEALKTYEDNWGTKEGVDQVRKTVQDNEMLMALMLSTPREEDREKVKVIQ